MEQMMTYDNRLQMDNENMITNYPPYTVRGGRASSILRVHTLPCHWQAVTVALQQNRH